MDPESIKTQDDMQKAVEIMTEHRDYITEVLQEGIKRGEIEKAKDFLAGFQLGVMFMVGRS